MKHQKNDSFQPPGAENRGRKTPGTISIKHSLSAPIRAIKAAWNEQDYEEIGRAFFSALGIAVKIFVKSSFNYLATDDRWFAVLLCILSILVPILLM